QPPPAQLVNVRITLELANGQDYSLNQAPGQIAEDGQFATPSLWPGRYFVRIQNPPAGWTFKYATYQGRDVSNTPIELNNDLRDVIITFTDQTSKIQGTVESQPGQTVAGAGVLLFPVDPAAWVDYGISSRR